ncbi:MAG: hypothetical protein SFV54_15380 [Bryobacteraceae bacterium]|nr:hypothetical protein [Bryobacteraceae bacterium]
MRIAGSAGFSNYSLPSEQAGIDGPGARAKKSEGDTDSHDEQGPVREEAVRHGEPKCRSSQHCTSEGCPKTDADERGSDTFDNYDPGIPFRTQPSAKRVMQDDGAGSQAQTQKAYARRPIREVRVETLRFRFPSPAYV